MSLLPVSKNPLAMVSGNYGTGKTFTAEFLNRNLGFELVSFDKEMNRLLIARYNTKNIRKIMDRMDKRTADVLRNGNGVIIDIPHATYRVRSGHYRIACEFQRQVLLIECICPEEVAKARIAQRPVSRWRHLPTNNPLRYDDVKEYWQDISLDFEKDPLIEKFLSYIQFDTREITTLTKRVTESLKVFTDEVCLLLKKCS